MGMFNTDKLEHDLKLFRTSNQSHVSGIITFT